MKVQKKIGLSLLAIFVLGVAAWMWAPTATAQRPGRNVVVVAADDTVIHKSCIIRIHENKIIEDVNGDGVIHVRSDDVTIEFSPGSVLRGAAESTPGDQLTGYGIRIDGRRNVKLKGLRVSGYRAGVVASRAPGLSIVGAEIEDNYRRRLLSTPELEDSSDWIYPHENDGNEWLKRYGAGIYVEDSNKVEIRNVRVRRGQNGIILDAVTHSKVYDNDCSFLSGWGLALYRSSKNIITRNAFDFCVRGFSHGVYNRGQDSAGILMFEQCNENIIAENSATHCGDGLFAFAGKEALGQKAPRDAGFDYRRKGNNDNTISGNDFSHAAAHGLELTFSFGNRVYKNRFAGNSICGFWGGYSQDTIIAGNEFIENGQFGYGLERGGINIEHGSGNVIHTNQFYKNWCGIHLWEDTDETLLQTPWAKANHKGCVDNEVSRNRFKRDQLVLHLRNARRTRYVDNVARDVDKELEVDDASSVDTGSVRTHFERPPIEILGKEHPVAARRKLGGKGAIVMTEWGPWDHESLLVRYRSGRGSAHTYEVFGAPIAPKFGLEGSGIQVRTLPNGPNQVARVELRADSPGVRPYVLTCTAGDLKSHASGTLVSMQWQGRVFPWSADPRKDFDAWKAESKGKNAVSFQADALWFTYGNQGPKELGLVSKSSAETDRFTTDQFGTIARGTIPLSAGTWKISTLSDDGIRVLVDGRRVIDNWTWHGPTRDQGVFQVSEDKSVAIEVLHFELDGYAVLNVELTKVNEAMSSLLDTVRQLKSQPQDCLKKILAHFDCVTGTIHTLNPESGLLEMDAQVGIPDVILDKVRKIPVGKGMAGIAAERKEPVQVCNLQTDDSGVVRPGAKETQVEGSIAVPMLVDGELRGVLGVAKPVTYEFTESQQADLLAIARILGGGE